MKLATLSFSVVVKLNSPTVSYRIRAAVTSDHLRPQPTRRTSWKPGLPTRCEL